MYEKKIGGMINMAFGINMKSFKLEKIGGYGAAVLVEPMINNMIDGMLPSYPFVNEIAEILLVSTLLKKQKGIGKYFREGVIVLASGRLVSYVIGGMGSGGFAGLVAPQTAKVTTY
jgi:hypothetical protein